VLQTKDAPRRVLGARHSGSAEEGLGHRDGAESFIRKQPHEGNSRRRAGAYSGGILSTASLVIYSAARISFALVSG
jgi:hypothetical protein